MKYLILDELNVFKCIGSKCKYTCCKDWEITVDSETISFYRNVSGEFGDKLRNSVIERDKVYFFDKKEGRCPFLNSNLLCDIYSNLGEEHMCTTCKVYPRKNWIYGDITFIGKCISCPEVARILFEAQSPLEFSFTEDELASNENIDWKIFNLYIKGMTKSIELIQNHEMDFETRMKSVVLFNYYFERHLENNDDCTELFDLFSSAEYILELTEKLRYINVNYNLRMALFFAVVQNNSQIVFNEPIEEYLVLGIDMLQKMDIEEFKQLWKKKENLEGRLDISHIHEQYCVYYISMYYMNFFEDRKPYKFIIQFLALFYLQSCFETLIYKRNDEKLELSDVIEIYTRTARVYEHSCENRNLETTYAILEKNDMNKLPFWLGLI